MVPPGLLVTTNNTDEQVEGWLSTGPGHTATHYWSTIITPAQLLGIRNYQLPSVIGFRLDDEGTHTLIISRLSVIIKIQ